MTSPPIGEAATLATFEDQGSALAVVQFAGVVAKVELGTVAAKVGLAHVVVGADHAALENGEEVFDRVAVLEATCGDIFPGAVIDGAVTVKFATSAGVNGAFNYGDSNYQLR